MLELGEVINKSIKSFVRSNVYTSLPAEVISVSEFGSEQTVDVKPLIRRVYEDNTVLESPNIYSVPVIFPSAGGGLLSFPIQVGDVVLVMFTMRSIDDWLEGDGSLVTPTSGRSHSITDAVCIPGLYTKTSNLTPNTTDVELKFKGMSVKLQEDNTLILTNSTATITLSPAGNITMNADGNIDITAGGTVSISGTTINLN